MSAAESLAQTAALLGHVSRARIMLALLDGRSHSASELAAVADVSAATASEHLAALTTGGLVRRTAVGRSRLFAIANTDVGRAVETLLALGPVPSPSVSQQMKPIRIARTCYDHLAGRVGVAITDALLRNGVLIPVEPGEHFAVTLEGAKALADFGVDVEASRQKKRLFAAQCIDWTERRPHLSGALGAAVAARAIELGWFERLPGTRVLEVTALGWNALARDLAISRATVAGS